MSGSMEPHQLEEEPKDESSMEEVLSPEKLALPQDPEGSSLPLTARAATPSSQSDEGSIISGEESVFPSEVLPVVESLMGYPIQGKVADLLAFLFFKYRKKEMTSQAEMLQGLFQGCEENFPEVFSMVSECLYVVFGIDVKKVSPTSHCYVLIPALGLSFDGMLDEMPSFPRTTVLLIILGVIYIRGNHASEEAIWEVLGEIGVFPGIEHVIYGEPWKFVTQTLVIEHYLEYRQVPDSDPPEYGFVWGPRALVETTKLSVLEFLARVKDTVPSSFNVWYEAALREEEEKFQPPDLPL
ncbi:melanoma-associated antigen 10-like [Cavia porcellus]|uniref:melanoma-associated antigen 10-like n=1 Tax=Cavia porcellus TaxID=10141 RepID=UPI002FE040CF